jgi:AcrR family transcriptional regulator
LLFLVFYLNSPFNKPYPLAMTKGSSTRAVILTEALAIANRDGLQGLTIGALADRCEMSKSGVFAHFGSREELQLAVVHEYHRCFEASVFTPALTQPRGLPRLQALFANWVTEVSHEVDVGSVYISGAVEFDERDGAVRDALVASVTTLHAALARMVQQAKDAQQLIAKVDPEQLVFEIHALILALHHDSRFLRKPASPHRAQQGFARLIQHYSTP